MQIRKVVKRAIRRIVTRGGASGPERHALVGDPVLASMKRDFQISFLKTAGLLPHHRFLDLGCGTLRGGIPIIQYLGAGLYYGVDVRPEVIAEATQELREHNLTEKRPTLLCFSDAHGALRDTTFDVIWAFSVLIHMPDTIFRQSIHFVADRLGAGGRFFANVRIGSDDSRKQWQGFPVVTRPLNFYELESQAVGLDLAVLGSLERLGHRSGRPQQDQQVMLSFTKGRN